MLMEFSDRPAEQVKRIAERIFPKPTDINLLLRELEILLAGVPAQGRACNASKVRASSS